MLRRRQQVPKRLDTLVRRKVEEGLNSADNEVIADALRLLEARDQAVGLKSARIGDAIDRGHDDAVAGRLTQFETGDEIDALFDSL